MGKDKTLSCGILITIKCKMNDRIRKTLLVITIVIIVIDKDHEWKRNLMARSLMRNRNLTISLHKRVNKYKGKMINFTLETSGRYHINQVIQINIMQ